MTSHEMRDVPRYTELNELSSKSNGGKILFATDDWFAEAERLLEDSAPSFDPEAYTEYGKLMDGWETRRKRCAGHDWCIIKLGVAGVVQGIEVDTSFFTGNFAPRFSVQAANLSEKDEALIPSRKINSVGTACSLEMHNKVKRLGSEKWTEIISMTELQPGYTECCHNFNEVSSMETWTHLRLNMYPDGGIARFKVYGESRPSKTIDKYETIDLLSAKNGGLCLGYSNAHFGHPKNLIRQKRSESMADGWETARRLDRPAILEVDANGILLVPGNEWAVFRLGYIGMVSSLIVDTKYFKGNYPDSVQIEGILAKPSQGLNKKNFTNNDWKIILTKRKLQPHRTHEYLKDDLKSKGPFSHIKITIAPDGGLSRIKVFGTVHENMFD